MLSCVFVTELIVLPPLVSNFKVLNSGVTVNVGISNNASFLFSLYLIAEPIAPNFIFSFVNPSKSYPSFGEKLIFNLY